MATRREIRAATRACAEELQNRLDTVAPSIGEALERAFPELAEDPDMAREFEASVRENLAAGIPVLAGDTAPAAVLIPEAVIGYARMLVHRQVGLDRLLEVYRVGHARVWRTWMDVLVERIEDRAVLGAALRRSADDLEALVERVVAVLVEEFHREERRWVQFATARRSDAVRRVLRDARADVDEASLELGHELRAVQTAVVVWSALPDDAAPALARVERAASAFAGELGAPRALAVPAGASSVWLWLATEAPVDTARLRRAAQATAPPDVRFACGAPAPGLEGFRAGHRQALRAQHVARRATAPQQLTAYADAGAIVVVSEDDATVRDFVAEQLGPLADARHAELRATLAAYFAAGGHAPRAAAELHTHRNTVLYRLRRAEALLGRPVGERGLELALALRIADELAPA